MWPWLLGIIGEAAAQADATTSPDELAAAISTIVQYLAGVAGVGGVGGTGVNLYLWRQLRDRMEKVEQSCTAAEQARVAAEQAHTAALGRLDAIDKALAGLHDEVEEQDDSLTTLQGRVSALSVSPETDQQLRDRLTRLETQHESSNQYLSRLDAAVDGVRAMLIQAGGRGG